MSTSIPAGLGDFESNITDIKNGSFKATAKQGIYKNEKTGEFLRVSSKGVWGLPFVLPALSGVDPTGFADFLNNQVAHVGRFTFIERLDSEGKAKEASYFRIGDKNQLIEKQVFKPNETHTFHKGFKSYHLLDGSYHEEVNKTTKTSNTTNRLTDEQLKEFRAKTEEKIGPDFDLVRNFDPRHFGSANYHNQCNKFLIPLAIFGIICAAIPGTIGAGFTAIGGFLSSIGPSLAWIARSILPFVGKLKTALPALLTKMPWLQKIGETKLFQALGWFEKNTWLAKGTAIEWGLDKLGKMWNGFFNLFSKNSSPSNA